MTIPNQKKERVFVDPDTAKMSFKGIFSIKWIFITMGFAVVVNLSNGFSDLLEGNIVMNIIVLTVACILLSPLVEWSIGCIFSSKRKML